MGLVCVALFLALCLSACAVTPDPTPSSELLSIDQNNVYAEMPASYSQGYCPETSNTIVYVILPLVSSGEIKDNEIYIKSYDKLDKPTPFCGLVNMPDNVPLKDNTLNDYETTVASYLIRFYLVMWQDTAIGQYPFSITVSYETPDGVICNQTFTVTVKKTEYVAPTPPPVIVNPTFPPSPVLP
jgi:hypothetical protein